MIILTLFFLVNILVLVLEQKKGDSSSTTPFLALQFVGIVIISFLAFMGEVSYYYITFMVALPFPSVLAAILILKILRLFEGKLGSKISKNEGIILDELIVKADLITEQVADLQNHVNNLSDHYQAMKQPSALWWLDKTSQKQLHHYERYVGNLENVLSNIEGYQKSMESYQADLEELVTNAPTHHFSFTVAENKTESTFQLVDNLMKDATFWRNDIEKKKADIQKKSIWANYQQKALAFNEQQAKVVALKNEYHQANTALQEFAQNLGQKHTLNMLQPGQLDQLETYLRLQQNAGTLSKLKNLQSEVLQLKRNMQDANQELQLQDKKVSELWGAYQQVNGGKVQESSLWSSYNAETEEIFWIQYEQVIAQMKRFRVVTIQRAG